MSSSKVETRRKMDEDPPPDHEADGGMHDDEDSDGPQKPQKRDFRTRAHSNVLNANDFWYPAKPSDVPVAQYYPGKAADGTPLASSRAIEFVDIGCGYGSLLLELAPHFPEALMLGIEIRPKIVEYVQRRVLALRHDAKKARESGAAAAAAAPAAAAEGAAEGAAASSSTSAAPAASSGRGSGSGSELIPGKGSAIAASAACAYENVWAVHNNAQRFMPNFFAKGQLSKLFFCFADPHFKKKNHRKRIVSTALLAEYAYVMQPLGLSYVITDVADLMSWIVGHFSACPLFERLPNEELTNDPAVKALILTDEGLKVTRNNGNMYIAVFRKRLDPLAPPPANPIPNSLDIAAAAAADAGYTPKEGGERRGMTW